MYTYALDANWQSLLVELGVSPRVVLRRAGLPDDLLTRPGERLEASAYHRLWQAIEAEAADPQLPLHIISVLRAEYFSPPLFAALCSPNLATAAQRLQHYKPLIGPLRLDIEHAETTTVITYAWPADIPELPVSLIWVELLFMVWLVRLGTRSEVCPVSVTSTHMPEDLTAMASFMGVMPEISVQYTVTFDAEDMHRPFVTANDAMWQIFEPELRRRLAELGETATFAERARAVLLEGLPSGQGSVDAVADRLAVSPRTLQRRLKSEGTSFQQVLNATREALARHYLTQTALAPAEISFLLGFEEPNSFYRAFKGWTGQTPEAVRVHH
ncbi:MAG: AraC family transcriptional regulator ligand-binding domain-containing protein [Bradymonadia bacterium]